MLRRAGGHARGLHPALRVAGDPPDRGAGNRQALEALPDKLVHTCLVEQYLLAACIEYWRAHGTRFDDVSIRYLFSSLEEAFSQETTARLGYTHLIADAKNDPDVMARLEARVERDHPGYHQACVEYLDRSRDVRA